MWTLSSAALGSMPWQSEPTEENEVTEDPAKGHAVSEEPGILTLGGNMCMKGFGGFFVALWDEACLSSIKEPAQACRLNLKVPGFPHWYAPFDDAWHVHFMGAAVSFSFASRLQAAKPAALIPPCNSSLCEVNTEKKQPVAL